MNNMAGHSMISGNRPSGDMPENTSPPLSSGSGSRLASASEAELFSEVAFGEALARFEEDLYFDFPIFRDLDLDDFADFGRVGDCADRTLLRRNHVLSDRWWYFSASGRDHARAQVICRAAARCLTCPLSPALRPEVSRATFFGRLALVA